VRSVPNGHGPGHSQRLMLHALQALPAADTSVMEAHLAECAECRREVESLSSVIDSPAAWPEDILRPAAPLWHHLARRIADETGKAPARDLEDGWKEPDWREAAPGLWYQLLAADTRSSRVTMLVRLEPGVEYPPHVHAGCEELHLLDGELWIDDRKLHPGDYNRAEAGTADKRVWSETGCTCVLITSHQDVLKSSRA
jgi:anti-sigma factor ChrR (cupin superfamily)